MKFIRTYDSQTQENIYKQVEGKVTRVLIRDKNDVRFDRRVAQYHQVQMSKDFLIGEFRIFSENPNPANFQKLMEAMISYQISKGIRGV